MDRGRAARRRRAPARRLVRRPFSGLKQSAGRHKCSSGSISPAECTAGGIGVKKRGSNGIGSGGIGSGGIGSGGAARKITARKSPVCGATARGGSAQVTSAKRETRHGKGREPAPGTGQAVKHRQRRPHHGRSSRGTERMNPARPPPATKKGRHQGAPFRYYAANVSSCNTSGIRPDAACARSCRPLPTSGPCTLRSGPW